MLIGTVAWAGHIASGQPCEPSWNNAIGQPGTTGTVRVFEIFDDGKGADLYVGGHFTFAGGVPARRIARWTGTSWLPLGSGMEESSVDGVMVLVRALAEFDDGNGPALYAGGNFVKAGGVTVNNIAKWDGTEWSPLGEGMDNTISSLIVYDDGDGPALYAGGRFTTAGGVPANGIAKWDGETWQPVGGGVGGIGWVYVLTVYDEKLVAGGAFANPGGVPAFNIAQWNGTSWAPFGSGLGVVQSLAVYDDGNGKALYAGGQFSVGGLNRIAKWDGASWLPLGSGLEGLTVFGMGVFNDGSGQELYVGGMFSSAGGQPASNVAKWDGAAWSPLTTGANSAVYSFKVFDAGDGAELHVGGSFLNVGGLAANRIATWRVPERSGPADLNCDNTVDCVDLLILLENWGECPDPDDCPADLNGDGVVDGADLLILLANWG